MGLLLKLDDNVARYDSWHLVAFVRERNLLAITQGFVDVNLEDLTLRNDFLAIALLALVFLADCLAFATAVWALLLELLHHGSHLTDNSLEAGAVAGLAGLNRPLFAAPPLAFGANDVF